MKELSIIYVNYNSADYIFNSINSFYYSTKVDFEIIIVDNSNSENELNSKLSGFKSIIYINAGYNAGFARANNIGIKAATGEKYLLINPDTLFLDEILDGLLFEFTHSNYVAAGVQLLNADLTPQISGNYVIRGGINHFLPLPCIGKFLKKAGELLKIKKTNLPDSNSTIEVDWINGAFILVKSKALQIAGLLDEDFFLYAEEIEWCHRLSKTGKLAIFGKYKLIHLEGASSNNAFESSGKGYYNLYDKKGLQIMVSNFLRIRKQFGLVWFYIHLLVYSSELFFLCITDLLSRITANKKKYPPGLISGFTRNLLQLYRLIPKIISNKPHFYKVL